MQVRQRWARATASAPDRVLARRRRFHAEGLARHARSAPPSPAAASRRNGPEIPPPLDLAVVRPIRQIQFNTAPSCRPEEKAVGPRNFRTPQPSRLGRPGDQTRRPYNRGALGVLAHTSSFAPLVTAFFRVCRSSNSRRRSGAARSPRAPSHRDPGGKLDPKACLLGLSLVPCPKRSLVSSSPAAPRAPRLLMQRRRAPATACPCAGAAGAGGCPLLCWR